MSLILSFYLFLPLDNIRNCSFLFLFIVKYSIKYIFFWMNLISLNTPNYVKPDWQFTTSSGPNNKYSFGHLLELQHMVLTTEVSWQQNLLILKANIPARKMTKLLYKPIENLYPEFINLILSHNQCKWHIVNLKSIKPW